MKLNCVGCGHSVDLDDETYEDYSGEVKCWGCGTSMAVVIENDHVRSATLSSEHHGNRWKSAR